MPELKTTRELAAHLVAALRARDRWVLFAPSERGRGVLLGIRDGLIRTGGAPGDFAHCEINYLDLKTRDRLSALVLTFPQKRLPRELLASILARAGYKLPEPDPDFDLDVVSVGGGSESLTALRSFVAACVTDELIPASAAALN